MPAPARGMTISSSGASGHRPRRLAAPEPSDELRALLVAAEAGHDVRPADLRGDRLEEREGLLESHLGAAVASLVHRGPGRVRDRDPGDLVVEELGVPGALERQDA